MQLIKTLLKIKSGQAVVAAADGHEVTAANFPQFKLGVMAALDLDLRADSVGDSGELDFYPFGELSAADAFYFALDADWDHKTQPPLFTAEGIEVLQSSDGGTHIYIPLPNTATSQLAELLRNKDSLQVNAEITGYKTSEGAGNAVFSFTFKLKIANRIFLNEELPDIVAGDPLYPTTAEIKAMIDAATRSETPGPKGDKGDKGDPGAVGKSTYDLYFDAEKEAGREPLSVADWLLAQKGEPGKDGKDGKDGKGLDFDAVGDGADRPLYDDKPKGFKFASSVTSTELLKTTVYVYTKLSDTVGDWSEPLIIDFYGSTASQIAVGKPIEVSARTEGAAYFYFTANLPNACIAGVSMQTADGEEFLPLNNDYGIRKIVKNGNRFNVYYGFSCPMFEKGYIYLTQLVTTGNDSGTTPPVDIVTSKLYYGYIEDSTLRSVRGVTQAMVNSAISAGTMKEVSAKAGEYEIGNVPAGAFAVCIVPENLTVQRDDGFGGKTNFEENAGLNGTGANGADITIGEKQMKIYGEFKLSNSEVKIYVNNI